MIQSVIRRFARSLPLVLLCHTGTAQETIQANQLQPTANVADLDLAQPQFTARLSWLKADWSKLENAAELEADLREVLAKESLASPEFDAGRASVLQVLLQVLP